jgi:hypothetical protein
VAVAARRINAVTSAWSPSSVAKNSSSSAKPSIAQASPLVQVVNGDQPCWVDGHR